MCLLYLSNGTAGVSSTPVNFIFFLGGVASFSGWLQAQRLFFHHRGTPWHNTLVRIVPVFPL